MSTIGRQSDPQKYVFARSENGLVCGVCQGLAQAFGIDLPLMRIIWLVAALWYGTGILLYVILALSLPRADQLDRSLDSKLLGVCARIASRYRIEVGLVRAGFLSFTLLSLGLGGVVMYVVCYFLIPQTEAHAGR